MARSDTYTALLIALALHLALGGMLFLLHGAWPRPQPPRPRLIVELDAPPEGNNAPMVILASLPQLSITREQMPSTPPETPPPPDPPPAPSHPLDAETRQELENERQELRAQLEKERALAAQSADDIARKALAAGSGKRLEIAAGARGTIRELDFSGWPQPVVDEIMARYGLRIEEKYTIGTSNQSFLSSASNSGGERYYAEQAARPGIYEVFTLSRQAIAAMSRLEEGEIRKRSLSLERTRVKRVVFGIQQTSPSFYDLGILSFSAEAVE
jgi:hypothetical protein